MTLGPFPPDDSNFAHPRKFEAEVRRKLREYYTYFQQIWKMQAALDSPPIPPMPPTFFNEVTGGGSSTIRFRNDAGTTVPAYGVMQISGAVVDSGSGERVTTIIQPDHFGSQYKVLVNGPDAVLNGAIGDAQLFGPVVARYDTGDGTPALGEIWGPRSGTWALRKNTGGFEIVGNPASANVLVNHAPWLAFSGVTSTAFAAGGFGTVRIYMGANGAETDTGVTMPQVFNRYASILTETKVDCLWNGRGFKISDANCGPG